MRVERKTTTGLTINDVRNFWRPSPIVIWFSLPTTILSQYHDVIYGRLLNGSYESKRLFGDQFRLNCHVKRERWKICWCHQSQKLFSLRVVIISRHFSRRLFLSLSCAFDESPLTESKIGWAMTGVSRSGVNPTHPFNFNY